MRTQADAGGVALGVEPALQLLQVQRLQRRAEPHRHRTQREVERGLARRAVAEVDPGAQRAVAFAQLERQREVAAQLRRIGLRELGEQRAAPAPQSPAGASSGWLKRPRSVKRSPQAGGGVASRRSACWRRPLRSTRSSCVSTSGAAPLRSSIQRSSALRMTNSCCCRNQSRARVSPLPTLPSQSRPATCQRPAAVAPHLEPRAVDQHLLEAQRQRQQRLRATARCARAAGAAPRGPRGRTGARRAARRPAPSRWTAPGSRRSSASARWPRWRAFRCCGRHSSMCGRITQCSVSHAARNTPHSSSTPAVATRAAVRNHCQRRGKAASDPGDEGETMRR